MKADNSVKSACPLLCGLKVSIKLQCTTNYKRLFFIREIAKNPLTIAKTPADKNIPITLMPESIVPLSFANKTAQSPIVKTPITPPVSVNIVIEARFTGFLANLKQIEAKIAHTGTINNKPNNCTIFL